MTPASLQWNVYKWSRRVNLQTKRVLAGLHTVKLLLRAVFFFKDQNTDTVPAQTREILIKQLHVIFHQSAYLFLSLRLLGIFSPFDKWDGYFRNPTVLELQR